MMKQVFHSIPRGSYYRMVQEGIFDRKMIKRAYLVLMAILLVMMSVSLVSADPEIQVSERYFKPGDVVMVTFMGDSGESLELNLTNSRGLIQTHLGSLGNDGTYVWTYTLNLTAPTDIYLIQIRVGESLIEDSFVVSGMAPRRLAESMRTLVFNAKKQAETALIQARKVGNLEEDVLNTYREAVQVLWGSGKLFEEGDYVQAMNQVRQALGMFNQVVDGVYNIPDVLPPQSEERDRASVQEAINRLQSELVELKKMVETLEKTGLDSGLTSFWFRRRQGELDIAKGLLDSNQFGEAVRQLTLVNNQLKSGRESLQQRQAEIRNRLASRYRASLENRYATMRDTLILLEAVNAGKVSSALGEIDTIQSSLSDARNSLQVGNTGEAVRTLWFAEQKMREIIRKVNGDETVRLFEEIDRLTLQLESRDQLQDQEHLILRIQIATQNLQDILRSPQIDTDGDTTGTMTPAQDNNALTP